jgi:hypothetical protein
MTKYIIPNLNGGMEIIDPVLYWTSAGFERDQDGNVVKIQLNVQLTTPQFKGSVYFDVNGTADDRSDEAIDALMITIHGS